MLLFFILFIVVVMFFFFFIKEDVIVVYKKGYEVIIYMLMEFIKGKKEWFGLKVIIIDLSDEEINN